jgi:predicted GIY-YIG superfamily endonuclease
MTSSDAWQNCSDQAPESYSSRHATKRLVHFEATTDVLSALRREKQLKRWSRLENPS